MIQIEQVRKSYGQKMALQIERLDIEEGEVIGLVGNNGAGKTTLLSLILDLIFLDEGQIFSKNVNVKDSEDWKAHTGAYISESFLIDFLTPEEYFEFVADLRSWSIGDLNNFLESHAEFFNEEILGQKKYIRDLSKGNQKKVGIVGALIGNPDLIIFDEPFANLDPTSQARLKNLIEELDTNNKTILISSHDINQIAEVSTRIIILEQGVIVKDLKKTEDALLELKAYFEV